MGSIIACLISAWFSDFITEAAVKLEKWSLIINIFDHISMEMRWGLLFFVSGIELGERGMGAIPTRYSRAFVYFC